MCVTLHKAEASFLPPFHSQCEHFLFLTKPNLSAIMLATRPHQREGCSSSHHIYCAATVTQIPEAPGREATATKLAGLLKPSLLRSCEEYGKPASSHLLLKESAATLVNNNTTRPKQAAGLVCKFRAYIKYRVLSAGLGSRAQISSFPLIHCVCPVNYA